MFTDYITLMLINMVAGLFLLAWFIYADLDAPRQHGWVPGFAIVGTVALATGLHMTLTWPIPQLPGMNLAFANVAFGEMTVLFGIVFLGAALAIAKDWGLNSVAAYAFIAGFAAMLVGWRIGDLGLTKTPTLTTAGFLLTGALGVIFCPLLTFFRSNRGVRTVVAIAVVAAALIWAFVGGNAYWSHLERFSQVPNTTQERDAD